MVDAEGVKPLIHWPRQGSGVVRAHRGGALAGHHGDRNLSVRRVAPVELDRQEVVVRGVVEPTRGPRMSLRQTCTFLPSRRTWRRRRTTTVPFLRHSANGQHALIVMAPWTFRPSSSCESPSPHWRPPRRRKPQLDLKIRDDVDELNVVDVVRPILSVGRHVPRTRGVHMKRKIICEQLTGAQKHGVSQSRVMPVQVEPLKPKRPSVEKYN